MRACRRGLAAAALALALAACAHQGPLTEATAGVTAREDLTRRFVIFIGARSQHAPPFLDTPGTNFYCLRSFLDRNTGAASYQVYVSDSYLGAERGWDGAHDGTGAALGFAHISTDEITCDGGCSYAEEFAAVIPESELRASPQGLSVTFTAPAGEQMTVALTGAQIAAQLAAMAAGRRDAPAASPHQSNEPSSASPGVAP